MAASSYYPKLTTVLNLDNLADELSFLEGGLDNLLDGIFVSDYQIVKSRKGDAISYQIVLKVYKRIGMEIPGGIVFLLNPPIPSDPDPLSSDIPVSVDVQAEILKYVGNFDILKFSSQPIAFFNLILELLGLDVADLFDDLISAFTISNSVNELVSKLNDANGLTGTADEIPRSASMSRIEQIEEIIDAIEAGGSGLTPLDLAFTLLSAGRPINEIKENLNKLFKSRLGVSPIERIKKLFIPTIGATLQVSPALEFPRKILTPVYDADGNSPFDPGDTGEPFSVISGDENEFPKVLFNFGDILLYVHSKTGLGADVDFVISSNVPAQIGNTGLIIDIGGIKVDFSNERNIPEADADGRPMDFKGVYIQEASITFPNIFNASADNEASIVARNLLIGSHGGMSGTIGIQSEDDSEIHLNFIPNADGFSFDVETKKMTITGLKTILIEGDGDEDDTFGTDDQILTIHIPDEGLTIVDAENQYYDISEVGVVSEIDAPAFGLLQFKIGEQLTITVEDFFLTFSKNKVVSSTVTGKIEIPSWDAIDEPLNFEIDFTDGFKIHVGYPDGVDVIDNSIFTLTLRELELGRQNDKFFVGLSAKLQNNLEIPYVNKFVPYIIDAHNLGWLQGDGFVYDLTLEWANGLKLGLSNDGPPALEKSTFRIPFNQKKDDGLFKLEAIDLSLAPVEAGVTVGVQLVGAVFNLKKIVVLTIDGLGAEVDLTKVEEGGNVGPFNAAFGLIPPKGIGLKVDAKAITGGGYVFLDFEKGRYVGVAELTIKDKISLKVIGIITTKLPSGEKGNSVLLLVTAEFSPINLSFGFTLNGVGGLVGINRDMNLQALRDGVKTNAIDNIMFPDDPVGNIAQIVSDLETIFPIQKGRYTFGVMGLIGWGTPTLITIELGLMLSVPKPVRLAVLGVVKCLLPTDDNDLVRLQINFVGTIDFEAKYITFDASIYDSKLLTFGLAGDMAFRLKWGDEPNFLFSVGGFHPSFTPPPLNLPTMNRLMINFLAEDNPRLTLSTYLAVTSNTVQMGSLLDFYFSLPAGLEVIGNLGFDILIQFSPFYLKAELYAMLSVLHNSKALFSISLYGMLEGPKPWHVQGKAEFVFLKIKKKVNFDKTFGEEENTELPDINVMPRLEEAANSPSNWQGVFPAESNLSVTLKKQEEGAEPITLSHPNGSLRFEQKVVPMNTVINKFGKQVPMDYQHFSMTLTDEGDFEFISATTKEFFAPADYVELSDNEKLARKSFEKMDSGLKVEDTNRYDSSDYLTRKVEYEQIVYDSTEFGDKLDGLFTENTATFQNWVNNNSTSNSSIGSKKRAKSNFAPNKMKVATETFTIANLEDLSAFAEVEGELTFGSEAEAQVALADLFTNNPELVDQIDVVLEHELV